MPQCFVKGCPHKGGWKRLYPDVVLHSFPNNIHLIKNWLLQTGQRFDDIDALSERILKGVKSGSYRMCSTHFTPESYMMKGSKRILKPNATPTIFSVTVQRVPILTQITLPPPRIIRVEDQKPFTASTIVRIVSRLVTVSTQTDERMFKKGEHDAEYWSTARDFATQTDDIETLTGQYSEPAVTWEVEKDLVYPAGFPKLERTMINTTGAELQMSVSGSTKQNVKPCMQRALNTAGATLQVSNSTKQQNKQPQTIKPPAHTFGTRSLPRLSEDTSSDEIASEKGILSQKKFIVFEECLDQLFRLVRCQCCLSFQCQAPITCIKKKLDGSMLHVYLGCSDGHDSLAWSSQPMNGNISIGNLLMSSSILLSGLSFNKVEQMYAIFGVPCISQAIYSHYQSTFLFPAIDYQWMKERETLKRQTAKKKIVLAGDSWLDTLGIPAKHSIYSMMDVISQKILAFQIEKLVPGKSSAIVKKTAFEKCLGQLLKEKMDIHTVATDRSPGIQNLIASKYPNIDHQYDVGRLCERVSKQLFVASKKRKCRDIAKWRSAICSHLQWCAQTCDQNVNVLLAKWKSVLFHISNVHTFKSLKYYTKCNHRRLSAVDTASTAWITSKHAAYHALYKIIYDPLLLKELVHIGKFCNTECLKGFHAKALTSCPERINRSIHEVHAQTTLAVLSHNHKVGKDQTVVKDSKKAPQEKSLKRLFSEKWLAFPSNEPSVDEYVFEIVTSSLKIVTGELRHQWISK